MQYATIAYTVNTQTVLKKTGMQEHIKNERKSTQMKTPNVYEARHKGRDFCNQTEGENHYKEGGIEPMDLFIAKGTAEDFCISNMAKYAMRFKITQNLKDLVKVSDYAQILVGVKLFEQEKE